MGLPRLEGYKVVRSLGGNGFAEVYEVRRERGVRADESFALKVLKADQVHNQSLSQQFLAEAMSASHFKHPAIAAVSAFGQTGDTLYLLSEFVDGIPVQALLANARASSKPFSSAQAAFLILELLEGIQFLHQLGEKSPELTATHAGVRPSNVMITFGGHVKLTDFGMSRVGALQTEMSANGAVSRSSTAYAAPELLLGRPATTASDIYGAGMLLYELVSADRQLEQRAAGGIDLLLAALPPASADLAPVLSKALASEPRLRFGAVSHFIDALKPFNNDPTSRSDWAKQVAQLMKALSRQGGRGADSTRILSDNDVPATPTESSTPPGAATNRRKVSLSSADEKDDLDRTMLRLPEPASEDPSITASTPALTEGASMDLGEEEEASQNTRVLTLANEKTSKAPAQTLLTSAIGKPASSKEKKSAADLESAQIGSATTHTKRKLSPKMVAALSVGLFVLLMIVGKLTRKSPEVETTAAAVQATPMPKTLPATVEVSQPVFIRDSEMIEIPDGLFRQGSEKKPFDLPGFFIDRYEVTTAQYLDFLSACPVGSKCGPKTVPEELHKLSIADVIAKGLRPVTNITWDGADAYAKWVGKTLPSSLEWEKAARGVDGREFPWDETPGSSVATAPVFTGVSALTGAGPESVIDPKFKQDISPYGAFGMGVNVAEWLSDAAPDGSNRRMVAGGSFASNELSQLKVDYRDAVNPTQGHASIGFRCVMKLDDARRAAQPLSIDRIKEKKVLRMGAEPSAPMLIKEPNGSYRGFEYHLGNALAAAFGVQVAIVEGRYGALPADLGRHNFDIILSNYVPARQIRGVVWSTPYYKFGLSLIVRADSEIKKTADLSGRQVGVFDDPAAESTVLELAPDVAKVVRFESNLMAALVNKQVDAVIYDGPFAETEIKAYPRQLKIVARDIQRLSYHVGIRQGEWSLLQAINAALPKALEAPAVKAARK